jgi:hypothetical protein
VTDYLGQASPEERAAREATTGIVSLLTPGLVREEVYSAAQPRWRKEGIYSITAACRAALKEVLRA